MCSPGVSYFCGQASAFSALPWKRGLPFYPHQSMLFKASAVSSSFSWKHWLSCTSHCWCTVDEGQCTLSLPPLSNGQNIWHCPWPIIWPVTVTSLKDSGERCHSKKKWKRRKREREEGVKKKKFWALGSPLRSSFAPLHFPLHPSLFRLGECGCMSSDCWIEILMWSIKAWRITPVFPELTERRFDHGLLWSDFWSC